MNLRNIQIVIIFALISTSLFADEKITFEQFNINDNLISYSNINDAWIDTQISALNKNPTIFSLNVHQNHENNNTTRDKLAFAWNLSDTLIINLSIFENNANNELLANDDSGYYLSENKSISKTFNNKYSTQLKTPSLDTNRNISGYKLGISSKFGLGNNFILNVDFDYGQLDDANLVGFNSTDVNTSSFALGFRKAKFGASLLSDTYLENNVDYLDHTRLGFEIDWYFSDDTSISFGSKQRVNSNYQSNQSSSLDSFTGNVQYIKFQHNL